MSNIYVFLQFRISTFCLVSGRTICLFGVCSFEFIFAQFEANFCGEVDCGLIGFFRCFVSISGVYGLAQLTICLFRPAAWPFLHTKTITF